MRTLGSKQGRFFNERLGLHEARRGPQQVLSQTGPFSLLLASPSSSMVGSQHCLTSVGIEDSKYRGLTLGLLCGLKIGLK